MAQMPLVLIPAYFVPLFVMLHIVALFQARRGALSNRSSERIWRFPNFKQAAT